MEPLFPCYLFARFALQGQLERVQRTLGVKGVVQFSGHWPTVADEEIEELRKQFGAEEVMERPLPRLQPGTEVDVVAGPFKGFRAVVKYDLPSAQRVQVLIDLLRRSTVVEMSMQDLDVPQSFPSSIRS